MDEILSRSCSFWIEDIPPLDDYTRIFLFSLILIYVYLQRKTSPIYLLKSYSKIMNKCEVFIYNDDSNSLFIRYILYPLIKESTIPFIKSTESICKICWICVILGFGGVYTMMLLFASIFILIGLNNTIRGMTHKYYCLFMVFGSLCFSSENRGQISIDYYIINNTNNTFSIHSTGFGCKLAAVLLVYTLFGAGVSKLRNPAWLNGESLWYYIYGSSSGKGKTALAQWMKQKDYIFIIFSVMTVVLEIGSIGILLPELPILIRLLFVLSFMAFHFGIWVFMVPNYMLQCICYIIFVPFAVFSHEHVPYCHTHYDHVYPYIIFGNSVVLLLIMLMVFKIESFPLTIFPMYSCVRRKSDCGTISGQRVIEIFKSNKDRNYYPVYCPIYHLSRKWLKLTLNIYQNETKSSMLGSVNINKFHKKGGTLASRRRNDAIYQIYLENKLKFPMRLGYGYFMDSDKIDQSQFLEIEQDLKELKYVYKYLKGLMILLQKRHLFTTYNVYPRYLEGKQGCYYEIKLNHNQKLKPLGNVS